MKKFTTLLFLFTFPSWAETNLELLQRLAKEESYGNVVKVFDVPDKMTSISALYSFQEMKLKPKDVLYFYVPEEIAKMNLSQIGFSHRQIGHAPTRDYNPGLTSALIYTKDMPADELRYWAGHSSGKLGAKFAEYRRSPEFDALFEWPRVGHKGIRSDKVKNLIRPHALRIQNVGTDDVYFSQMYIETIPEQASEYQNVIFTPNSDFGDPATFEGRYYGGGQNQRGTFPNALKLGSDRYRSNPTLPQNMILNRNQLQIDLPIDSKLKSVDVMCGDTKPDGIRNKDGGWGSLGHGILSIIIENTLTGERRVLLDEKNVGPQGVLTAADISTDLKIKAGDKLVIINKRDRSTVYLMGIRIGYDL